MEREWDPVDARAGSLTTLLQLGYPHPPAHFPAIEGGHLRALEAVVDRLLVVNVVINCAFRMPVSRARGWLGVHGLEHAVSDAERTFMDELVNGAAPDGQGQQLQVEAAWALAWNGWSAVIGMTRRSTRRSRAA